MDIKQRLSLLLKISKVIPFDDTSKFIFVSDIHMGVGDTADNFKKLYKKFYETIKIFISNGYKLVLSGDIYELWENKNLEEIRNTYLDIFLLLDQLRAEGKLYEITGNHDLELGFRHAYVLDNGKEKILVCHGYQGELFVDNMWTIDRFLVRYLWRFLETCGVPDISRRAKHSKQEKLLREWAQENTKIICGHTHRPAGDGNYWNMGSWCHGDGSAVLLSEGKLSLLIL